MEEQNWAGVRLEPTPLCPVSSVLCSGVCGRGGAALATGGGAKRAEGAGSPGLPSCSGAWVHQAGWNPSWNPARERQDRFLGWGRGSGRSLLGPSGAWRGGEGVAEPREPKLGHWSCEREKLRKVSSPRQILGTGEGRGLRIIWGPGEVGWRAGGGGSTDGGRRNNVSQDRNPHSRGP